MKRLSLLLVAFLSVTGFPLGAAEIRSIYLAADAHARIEMGNILRKQWPELRIAERASEADAILELRVGIYRPQVSAGFPEPARAAVVQRTSQNGVTTTVLVSTRPANAANERGTPTALVGKANGVLRLRGSDEELIIYSALPSPFFATKLAKELVALRDHLVD